jgi:hypothetical protein
MDMTDEQQAIASELFACDKPVCQYCGADCSEGRSWDGGELYTCPPCADARAERLVVRFDPNRLLFWSSEAKSRQERNCLPATILHYKEGIALTPTGGRYRYQRMTVRIAGRVWIGQTKNGTDVVRLRPANA